MLLKSVVFPTPFGPRTHHISPGLIVIEILESTGFLFGSQPIDL
ncbi:hypothetical protein NBRC111894_1159 [Sporolactobacillus inulinus]|uniref:Uncharacterized protein n=1 Tax=Sporolactobacillus inulinus TaxID=2078 RepID=A0A4Y1Z9B9_9BACL|nr:hypothetical protein NBRC111894_1159 [Sporolactobacillus inulinus]